jgi:hypothetical protein
MPGECRGKRVRVKLRSGHTFEAPADGRGACRWSLTDDAFDIVEWELAT